MEQKALDSIANFAIKFCNELGKDKTTVCSPISAESVLALLALGCRNESHTELLKALDFPDDEALRSSFDYVTSALKSVEGATLNMANKLYLKKGGCLKMDLRKDAEEVFKSDLEQLDFEEKEAAAETINKWVEHETNNKIKEVVSPEMFDDQTGMVLVNAIYFLGTWEKTFNEILTKNRTFYVNSTTQIEVPMMHLKEEVFLYKDSTYLNAQILKMFYKGGESNMLIVLPKEIEGLAEVMKKLAAGSLLYNLMTDIESFEEAEVNVKIPKFRVEMTIDLKEILFKLGITSIFDPETADIDMLNSNGKLYVSQAVQKAVIEVNETGTEAAACTMMELMFACKTFPVHFTADRPFLYVLTVRNIPVFIGVYEGSEYASK